MHDWQTRGGNQFGADFGRSSDLPVDFDGSIQIRRVVLDDGGYDSGGAYWGTPSNLYCAFDAEGRTFYRRGTCVEDIASFFPRAKVEPVSEVTDADIEDMLEAYMRCALWSTCGDDPDYEGDPQNNPGGVPLDTNYNESDIDEATVEQMRKDCAKFAHDNAATLIAAMQERPACDWAKAGHDLWLNRNGHGCGFWDGDWPKPAAEVLDKAADEMGGIDLYAGDDGKIRG